VNIVLASSYIFHDVGNIVKHSLIINKWKVEINKNNLVIKNEYWKLYSMCYDYRFSLWWKLVNLATSTCPPIIKPQNFSKKTNIPKNHSII